jgi:hypothetical protein
LSVANYSPRYSAARSGGFYGSPIQPNKNEAVESQSGNASNLLQVDPLSFDSAMDITELSELKPSAILFTEQEVDPATAAQLTSVIVQIELLHQFVMLDLKYSMSGNV